MNAPPRFVLGESQLTALRLQAKLMVCPHCGRLETLIGHGKLKGYSDQGNEQVIRGQRFFCSNRYVRPSCGTTHSALLAHALRNFSVWTRTLVAFVVAMTQEASVRSGWVAVARGSMGLSSEYRLWRRLTQAQLHIRAKLFIVIARPPSSSTERWA